MPHDSTRQTDVRQMGEVKTIDEMIEAGLQALFAVADFETETLPPERAKDIIIMSIWRAMSRSSEFLCSQGHGEPTPSKSSTE